MPWFLTLLDRCSERCNLSGGAGSGVRSRGPWSRPIFALPAEASAAIRMGETRKAMSRVAFTIKGEKRLGASPNRFPGCVLEVVLKY